jgi:pimeloyl-ACP methyl ester carboxylesterase
LDLILVHGALGAAEQLEPLRALIAASGREVHVVELEGHGNTHMADRDYSIRRFGGNITAFMARMGIERAAIFGYSMGGYAALALAGEVPDRVAAVATLGTKLAWTPEVAARETTRLDPATIRAKVPKFASQLEARHQGAGGWEAVLARTASLMTGLGAKPIVDQSMLAEVAQPVRFMVGDRDALVTLDETAAAAKSVPKGELAILPNTPHPIEQARLPLLAGQIADFMTAVSAR